LAGRHHSVWPWSDLVSLAIRFAPRGGSLRVLELGCGIGANIPFFLAKGDEYYAIEGSAAAVAAIHRKFPSLQGTVTCGDFTQDVPFGGPFDLIVDRSAMTHNDTESIKNGLIRALRLLGPGKTYLGIDWFSIRHPESGRGTAVDDRTRRDFGDGPFHGVGKVHFSDEPHLRDLFASFQIVLLEEKQIETRHPDQQRRFASWNIVARRPETQ
jgi:SAM-dependent methyltransferase